MIAELRELLDVEPSTDAFAKICKLMALHRANAEFEVAMDYALQHLASWPDEVRFQVLEHTAWAWYPSGGYLRLARTLYLRGVSEHGVRMLVAKAPYFADATALFCGKVQLGDEGVKAIAKSPYMANLKKLYFAPGFITIVGAKAIASSPNMSNLQELCLDANPIHQGGAKAIAESPYMSNLKALYMGRTGVDSAGIKALAGSPYMSNLQTLSLSLYHLGDVRSILTSEHFGPVLKEDWRYVALNEFAHGPELLTELAIDFEMSEVRY